MTSSTAKLISQIAKLCGIWFFLLRCCIWVVSSQKSLQRSSSCHVLVHDAISLIKAICKQAICFIRTVWTGIAVIRQLMPGGIGPLNSYNSLLSSFGES